MKWRFILATFFVGLSLHTFAATVYTDKIEIVDGSLPHLVYSRNKGVNFAVDAYGSDGWKVTVHHERGWGYVAEGVVGSAVNNQTFSNDLYSVTGTGDIFRVAFRWWYKDAQATIYHYGWFTLSKQDDALVVVASEVSDDPYDTIVGRGEPNLPEPIEPPDIRRHFTDHGDWLSLPRGCISEEVSGWLDIPPQLNGKPVKAIEAQAFISHQLVTYFSVPETIQSIGDEAFAYCSGLSSFSICPAVTNIGQRVLATCTSLDSVVVDSAAIAPYSFAETPMRHLAIGQACTNIPGYAFFQCQNLMTISFPINLEYIAENAFAGCPALKEVSLPYGTVVHSNAFHAAVKITRWGPEVVADGLVQGLRTAEKGTLMRLVGMQRMKNASLLFSRPDNDDGLGLQPDDAVGICVKLGITPSDVYESPDGQYFTISFKVPSVKVVAFDPAAGKVTGKVIPAVGTRIAEPPMSYAFGLNYWEYFGQPNQYIKPLGWEWPYDEHSTIKLDLSRYMETGEFTFTYPLWYPFDDCPAIFSVDIGDYNWNRE